VVSNLGRLGDHTNGAPSEPLKFLLFAYHNITSLAQRNEYIEAANKSDYTDLVGGSLITGTGNYMTEISSARKYTFQNHLDLIHDFTAVGYANTVGFAHAHHGDTMTSVHIGGLRTVMNGDFAVECGDKIQWYWPDENAYMDRDGKRLPVDLDNVDPKTNALSFANANNPRNPGASDRENFYSLQFGQKKNAGKYVPRVKTYEEDEENPRIYDSMRVFAVAISSARPHEMFDIMIARQAI
jgi:hypothetical protein